MQEAATFHTWRPITRKIEDWDKSIRRFRHIESNRARIDPASEQEGSSGESVWGSTELELAIYFQWAELGPGVFVLCDPMRILTNVRLTTDSGESLGHDKALLVLNRSVYGLSWQRHAAECVNRSGAGRRSELDMPFAGKVPVNDSFFRSAIG